MTPHKETNGKLLTDEEVKDIVERANGGIKGLKISGSSAAFLAVVPLRLSCGPQRQEECSCQGEKEACNLCPPNAFEKNIQTLERCLEALSSVAHESLELAKELHKRADDDSRKLSL